MEIPATFAEARLALTALPLGRAALGIRALRLAVEGLLDDAAAVEQVAADVGLGLVLRTADAELPVTDGMLRQWGATLSQAVTSSFDVHGGESPRIDRVEGTVVVTDRSFAAFVLRRPAAADGLLDGRPAVALVPADGVLVIAPRDDPAALSAAAAIAERTIASGAGLVSAIALVRAGERWETFSWPPGALPAASAFQRRFAVAAYDLQRPVLQGFYDGTGQPYRVAEAQLVVGADGEITTVARLAEGVPTALPWVDTVHLVRGDAVLGAVPMARMIQVPGLVVRLADLDPPLFYPTRFPAEVGL